MYSCSLFCSLPLIFTLGAASISHFLTAAIKFSCYSYDEIGFLCFLSLASSFSVIHISLDIKIKSKERIGFAVVIFPLKVRVAMLFTAETRGHLKCKISIRLTWRSGRTYVLRTDDFAGTKISWMHRLPNFLTHGAPLPARELR